MKKILRIILALVAVIVLAVAGLIGYIQFKGIPSYEPQAPELSVTITPAKVEHGARLSIMLCSHCHMSDAGVLEGNKLHDIDPALGEVYAPNITQDPEFGIADYTDGELAYLLRTGIKRDGKFAPPYMPKFPKMAQDDLEAIIAYLKSDHPDVQPSQKASIPSKPSFLTKALCNFVIKPFPYIEQPDPKPSVANKVAYGKYLLNHQLHCYACHSADITKINAFDPITSPGYLGGGTAMRDMEGNVITVPNITMDKETGIGKYNENDFITLLKTGKRPDGTMVRYPMRAYVPLDTVDIQSIYEYIKTVPVIKNDVSTVKQASIR